MTSPGSRIIIPHNYEFNGHWIRSGDLGGLGGRSPQHLRQGDGPCIGPPNILRSSVVGCARKHEQSKKIDVIKEFFSEIGPMVLFLVKKGSYTTFNTVKIRKIRKTWSMTKKKSSEILGVKMEIFLRKKIIQKFWSAKDFFVPPNSAPGLRHCIGSLTIRLYDTLQDNTIKLPRKAFVKDHKVVLSDFISRRVQVYPSIRVVDVKEERVRKTH